MSVFQEYRELMRLSKADKRAINKRNWRVTNERRIFLIDKGPEENLSADELLELEHLQELAGVHCGRNMWRGWQMLERIEELLASTNISDP